MSDKWKICVANTYTNKYKWLTLPLSNEELEEELLPIQTGAKWILNNAELPFCYNGMEIVEINQTAQKFNYLNKHEQEIFLAYCEYNYEINDDIFNKIDKRIIKLHEDINNYYELGYYLINSSRYCKIPEFIQPYIDYETFGEDTLYDTGGAITSYGWLEVED